MAAERDGATGAPVWPSFFALVALALAAFLFVDALLNAQAVFSDWHAYYRAATALRSGADLYAEGKELLARNSYDYWVHTDGHYVYPPLLAMVLTPLAALLDIGKSGDVWLGVLALATAGFLWTAARLLGRPLRVEALAPLGVVTLASVPLLLGVRYGQVDVVLLLLLALALLAHVRGRDLLAGVALGAAAAVKPTLALYGLYYLRKRAWATLAAVACLYFLQPWLDFAYNRGGAGLRGLVASGAYLYGLLLTIAALVVLLRRERKGAGRAA